MTRVYLTICMCLVFGVGVVALLALSSGVSRDRRSNFLRVFPPHAVVSKDTVRLGYNSYYLAGGTEHTIYLGNYRSPLRVISIDVHTLDTQRMRLQGIALREHTFRSAQVEVDSPYVYLSDGTIPITYQGRLPLWDMKPIGNDSLFFRDLVPMNRGAFAIKSLSGETGEQILGKMMSWAPYRQFSNGALEKQVDGVFCTDGTLLFDRQLGVVVYVYYYRNEFIVMDSSLRVAFRGHTIDTTTHAKLEVAVSESGMRELASPLSFVNASSCVWGDQLFVNSHIQASNEHRDSFKDGSVIDVYALSTGSYQFSFYLSHLQGKGLTDFAVYGDWLVAMYGDVLQVYKIQSISI